MDIAHIIVLALLISATKESTIDGCPPADPNCHPSCIVYTADHCRYCMCKDGMGSSSSSSSGSSGSGFGSMSSDAAWDRGFEGGDWSSKMNADSSSWSNSGGSGQYSSAGFGSSSGSNEETVKYVIVEKEPEPQIPSYAGGGPMSALPNLFPGGMSSPFGSMHMPSSLLPGSNNIVDSHSYGSNVIHVPLLAPGIPKYCVRCKILSCPGTCERTDEYGCKSCPCAPSRYQTMPVIKDCSEPDVFRPDCSATKLCIESCRDGYQLGEVGRDGCQSCTCIRRAQTTPKPEATNCPATLKCMLQCKDGYLLGDKQGDGCPSCKCLLKGMNNENTEHSSNNNNMASNNNNMASNNNNNWGGNSWEKNGGQNNGNSMNSGTGTGTGSGCSGKNNNYLSSTNGIGSGKCEPPMCLSGHMSIDEAMSIGASSAGGGAGGGGGCDEGNNAGTGVMDMGSLAGMSSSNSGGSSSSSGGFNMGGAFGSGSGMTGGGGGGASASGSGMPSPFSVSMSGAGAGGGMGMGMGMGMGGGGGGGGGKGGSGMPFSPFSSAMSGGGPGMGMSGSPGMGGMRGGASSAMGTETAVSAAAYNKDCIGAECSAKNGMQHKDCPDLIHCLVTCDGKQMLGELDANGCQTCTCI